MLVHLVHLKVGLEAILALAHFSLVRHYCLEYLKIELQKFVSTLKFFFVLL